MATGATSDRWRESAKAARAVAESAVAESSVKESGGRESGESSLRAEV